MDISYLVRNLVLSDLRVDSDRFLTSLGSFLWASGSGLFSHFLCP
jgi:hypothetical protein